MLAELCQNDASTVHGSNFQNILITGEETFENLASFSVKNNMVIYPSPVVEFPNIF